MRRRFKRRGTKSLTTRSTGASDAFKHRGRKIRKRAFRRILYRSTILDPHYRSIQSRLDLLTTPTPVTDCAAAAIPAIPCTTQPGTSDPLPFWKRNPTINQPFQQSDVVGGSFNSPTWTVPANPDPRGLIIRGGRYYITANCQSNDDPCNVRIQLAFAKQATNSVAGSVVSNTLSTWFALVNSISPKPLTWTYPQQADYDQFFYPPVLDRVVRLLPGEDVQIVRNIKPVKIDPAIMRTGGGWYPYWFIYASQSAGNVEGNPPVGFITGYSLSFSVTADND